MIDKERAGFEKHLTDNEDDNVTRLIFADWLDEHDEPEEANRMRAWQGAKEWLVAFLDKHNDSVDNGDYDYTNFDYSYAVRNAHKWAEDGSIWCGSNMGVMDAIDENREEFCINLAIITGASRMADQGSFITIRCGC